MEFWLAGTCVWDRVGTESGQQDRASLCIFYKRSSRTRYWSRAQSSRCYDLQLFTFTEGTLPVRPYVACLRLIVFPTSINLYPPIVIAFREKHFLVVREFHPNFVCLLKLPIFLYAFLCSTKFIICCASSVLPQGPNESLVKKESISTICALSCSALSGLGKRKDTSIRWVKRCCRHTHVVVHHHHTPPPIYNNNNNNNKNTILLLLQLQKVGRRIVIKKKIKSPNQRFNNLIIIEMIIIINIYKFSTNWNSKKTYTLNHLNLFLTTLTLLKTVS